MSVSTQEGQHLYIWFPGKIRHSKPRAVCPYPESSAEQLDLTPHNSSNSKTTSTSTPTLTALLSRSRSRKQKKPLSISHFSTTSSATPDYSPGSTEAFLQRLSTFSLPSYSSKPPQIDAVAASKAGWINEGGKDRLFCSICKIGWVVAGRTGLSKDAGE